MDAFVAKFLALDRVPKLLPHDIVGTVDLQLELLRKTLGRETVKLYPLPSRHVVNLLEAILRSCEKTEVAEEVYERLATYLHQSPSEAPEFGLFTIGDHDIVFQVHGDSSAFVQNGSTGFITWEAGKCLSWFVGTQLSGTRGKRILELGCGTGVTGMVIAATVKDAKYTLTDYHEATLDQARDNWALNQLTAQAFFKSLDILDATCNVDTDLIIGADILYSEELCRGLVSLLNRTDIKFEAALIMTTIRTESTYAVFLDALKECRNLSFESVMRKSMSQWIAATEPGSDWRFFLDSATMLFDPEIELVRIVKK